MLEPLAIACLQGRPLARRGLHQFLAMSVAALPQLLLLLLLTTRVPRAGGHGMLSVPTPRAGTTIAGNNKNSGTPCGSSTNTKGPSVGTFTQGQTTAVQWALNAGHNGPCEIRIAGGDPGGEPNFAALQPITGGTITACNAAAQATVTIPVNLPPGDAVLQWYWDGDGDYHNCADITIQAAAATGTGSSAAAATSVR